MDKTLNRTDTVHTCITAYCILWRRRTNTAKHLGMCQELITTNWNAWVMAKCSGHCVRFLNKGVLVRERFVFLFERLVSSFIFAQLKIFLMAGWQYVF